MLGVIQQRKTIYFIAAVLSLILSIWASFRSAIINPDAICYLQSAATMKFGLHAAMNLCGQARWPFYSALIYYFSGFTHFSYTQSAFILDGLFSLISVVTFIAIVRFFTDNIRTLLFAALIILLCHDFNAVREYIIRDHGFWAFYLLSILFLLHFMRTPNWRYALGWSSSLIIATLFRIEGLFFLLFLPFCTVLNNQLGSRWRSFFQLNSLTIFAGFLAGIILLLHPHQSINQMGRMDDLSFQLFHGINTITQHFHDNVEILKTQILNQYSAHDAALILSLVLICWYILNIVGSVSPIFAFLITYSWWNKLFRADKSAKIVLWSYIFINIAITTIFLAERMFFSKRYLVALALTLLIWAPFALENLSQQWVKRRWPLSMVLFLILISALSGIFDFGYSKAYIRDAGYWLEMNMPKTAKFYSNDYQLMYYSHYFGESLFTKAQEFSANNPLENNTWKQYDYLALRFNKKDLPPKAIKELGSPLITFVNKRGDAVSIYQIRRSST